MQPKNEAANIIPGGKEKNTQRPIELKECDLGKFKKINFDLQTGKLKLQKNSVIVLDY